MHLIMNKDKSMRDTRQHQRIPLDGQGTIKAPVFGNRLRVMRAYLDDISLGGARLYAEDGVDVDQPVKMRVRIPWSGRVVEGTGRVRHVALTRKAGRPLYALGVEFMHMNRQKIRRMIEDKLGGGRRKFAAVRHKKKEIGLLLKLSPVLIIATWLLIDGAWRAQGSVRQEQQFEKDFKKGVLHFLYNSK